METLIWTFIHSLWLGLIAALVAAIIILVTPKATARLRYHLLCVLLALFLSSISVTFFVQLNASSETLSIVQKLSTLSNGSTNLAIEYDDLSALISNWVNQNTSLLIVLWAVFFLFNALRLSIGLNTINRLRTYKTQAVPAEWQLRFSVLQQQLGIKQSIALLQSELVKVPVALGFFKPVILLPIGLIAKLPVEQVEAILLHELGHIKRKDYLVNFLQHATEAFFFFNPGILWISALIRQEREACCDDIAIIHTAQKADYLNALVSFEEFGMNTRYALGIGKQKHQLLSRVKRLITNENKKLNMIEKLALVSALFLFSAFSYVNREQEPVKEQVKISVVKQQQIVPVKKKPVVQSVAPTKKAKPLAAKKEIVNVVKLEPLLVVGHEVVTDTLASIGDNMEDPAQVLKKIINIKERIGERKEIIGTLKVDLGNSDEKEKAKIMQRIEKERGIIEEKRVELNKFRAKYEVLKKQKS
jgi:beta-lactamase regulating signal transducer with metallopeptidase domain